MGFVGQPVAASGGVFARLEVLWARACTVECCLWASMLQCLQCMFLHAQHLCMDVVGQSLEGVARLLQRITYFINFRSPEAPVGGGCPHGLEQSLQRLHELFACLQGAEPYLLWGPLSCSGRRWAPALRGARGCAYYTHSLEVGATCSGVCRAFQPCCSLASPFFLTPHVDASC